MLSKCLQDTETSQITSKLPILEFLNKKKKTTTLYIQFSVQAVQIYKTHAKYKIEVDYYGKIWIMEIRYSTLLELHKKIMKHFGFHFTFPSKIYMGNLDSKKLKKRAREIQTFLNELSKNYQITNSDEMQQFLTNIEHFGIQIVDYSEIQEFNLI